MDPSTSCSRLPPPKKRRRVGAPSTIQSLSNDSLCMVFAYLDLFDLVRCSVVCKFWNTVVDKSKLLHICYSKQLKKDAGLVDMSSCSESSLRTKLEELAMDQHRFSLQEGCPNICQWKGHLVGVDQCRMKMGLVLTGVGDKVMRLWSVENYKCLDEYYLPDKAPLVDFDFDESKVVGLVGTRLCIWRRHGKRNVFSSREGLFNEGLCMCYVDPEAVVGCEDGTARIFDMYSRKCSQILKMNGGPITSLSLSDDQLIAGGTSLGRIVISGLSSDQHTSTLRSPDFAGIRTLCFNACSNILYAGSTAGNVSCWDLRMMRNMWTTRASPNVLYSMHHLRNDRSTLVIGGIDGVLRVLDQRTGKILSRWIMDESSRVSNSSKALTGVVEKKKARRLSEDTRIDLIPKIYRPPIRSLAVGMQKVVTTHNDKHIRVWKFNK